MRKRELIGKVFAPVEHWIWGTWDASDVKLNGYNNLEDGEVAAGGEYTIQIGSESREDVWIRIQVEVNGTNAIKKVEFFACANSEHQDTLPMKRDEGKQVFEFLSGCLA